MTSTESILDDLREQLRRQQVTLRELMAQTAKGRVAVMASETPQPVDVLAPGEVRMVGSSPAVREVIRLCERVAKSPTTALVLGPTGTGKELAAQLIHERSGRRAAPFVPVNCGALPESIVESELFGHEKGAFTGAIGRRLGCFEISGDGTLFLDEIGELPLAIQAKLLRVLEDHRFTRLGGTQQVAFRARIVAATNRDLKEEVDAGRFREDLYYRLAVFLISMPALAERLSDVPELVSYFLEQIGSKLQLPRLAITDEALQALTRYGWPGNVRQLRNVLERAALMSDGGVIGPDHLPSEIHRVPSSHAVSPASSAPLPAGSQLFEMERLMVRRALEENNWNKAAAARQLGISWDHLRTRIKRHRIVRPGANDSESHEPELE